MTTVENITSTARPNVGRLIGSVLAVSLLVGGIGFVVYTGTKPVPPKVDSYAEAMATADRLLKQPNPNFVAEAAAYQKAHATPTTGRAACLDAIDKANYATHHQSSEEAISASTAMLRACDTGR